MAQRKDVILTTEISSGKAFALLKNIAKGNHVFADERLDVIQDILAFSPRDWSTDEELWLLYQVVFNKAGENYMPTSKARKPR